MLSHLPVNLLICAGHSGTQHNPEADHPATKPTLRALILGGGDGGVLNRCAGHCSPWNEADRSFAQLSSVVAFRWTRLLQHDEVTHVTLVEIDQVVMATAARYFSFVRRHVSHSL